MKEVAWRNPRPRPDRTSGNTIKVKTGCGNLYVTVNSDSDGISELFAQMGKSGGCQSCQVQAIGHLVSLALRCGIDPDSIVKQIEEIKCASPMWSNGVQVLSCADAIAKVLKSEKE